MTTTPSAISAPVAEEFLALIEPFDYPTAAWAAEVGVPLETLENEHIRLFGNDLGGVKAPPFAGCYLAGEDRIDFMVRFGQACRNLGIDLDGSFPPDYIPLMIEVLAMLHSDGQQTVNEELVNDFYRIWPGRFADAIFQHDATGVFATAAGRLRGVLEGLAMMEMKESGETT
jgi:putative dimethyl sulfoxide reductase chaperone